MPLVNRAVVSMLTICLFSSCISKKTDLIKEDSRLVALAKVWGFAKYNHPSIAKGEVDWDGILIKFIPEIIQSDSFELFNQKIQQMIAVAGGTPPCDNQNFVIPDTLENSVDFGWMNDKKIFSSKTISALNQINPCHSLDTNVYVEVSSIVKFKEKPTSHGIFPSEELRILALFRYWNTINYFYPYKYLMDRNWDDVLIEFIPKFRNVNNATEYLWLVRELNAMIDDGHSGVRSRTNNGGMVYNNAPLRLEYLDGETVVSGFRNDSVEAYVDMKIGDLILKKDGIDIKEIRDSLSSYFRGSNVASTQNGINGMLLMSDKSKIELEVKRGESTLLVETPCYDIRSNNRQNAENDDPLAWKMANQKTGYIDAGVLDKTQVDEMMEAFQNTNSLIIDMRKYPKYGAIDSLLQNYLCPVATEFCLIKYPNPKIPGTFYFSSINRVGPKFFNSNHYKGKVVILVSEKTGSQGEFSTMKLQAIPNSYTIGRQTAGADGNVAYVDLPGDLRVAHSGIGIYYPDSSQTQRVGIRVDQIVKRDIDDIINANDEILEEALKFVN